MGQTRTRIGRRFFACAEQRLDDAESLVKTGRFAGAISLAGYAVECGIKTLILETATNEPAAEAIAATFRGRSGHDLRTLRETYHSGGGPASPPAVVRDYVELAGWTSELRYDPRARRPREAEAFLGAATRFLDFARGRL